MRSARGKHRRRTRWPARWPARWPTLWRWRLLPLVVPAAAVAVALALVFTGGSTPGVHYPANELDPGHFAVGACEAFAPTTGDLHTTVFLDASNGGVDPGAIGATQSGSEAKESLVTLPMELDAMTLLRAAGYRVVVSRTANTTVTRLTKADLSDGFLTLRGELDNDAARTRCADDAHAAVLVGISLNAADTTHDGGCLAAYDSARPFAAQNAQLATLMQRDVLADMNANGWNIPNKGVVADNTGAPASKTPPRGNLAAFFADYGHLLLLGPAEAGFFTTPSTMPGAEVEPLFITDPFEASVAVTTAAQQAVASGVAQAVEQFLGSTPAATTTTAARS